MPDEPAPDAGTSDLNAGTAGTPGGAGEGEEVAKLRADNTRLRMAIAENEQLSARAVPFVKIGQALIKAPGGKEIIEKLNKGESLTVAEQKQIKDVQADTADKPLTKAEAETLFQGLVDEATSKMGETVAAERKATDNLAALEAKGEKELEGFGNLKRDPFYQRQVNDIIEQVKDGTIEVPKEEDDLWWFAMKTAHTVVHAVRGGPAKKKGKTESERVAEALAAGGSGPSSRAQEEEEVSEEIKKIREIGTRTIAGKSFGNPGMNR